jgi:hypothetical protein
MPPVSSVHPILVSMDEYKGMRPTADDDQSGYTVQTARREHIKQAKASLIYIPARGREESSKSRFLLEVLRVLPNSENRREL